MNTCSIDMDVDLVPANGKVAQLILASCLAGDETVVVDHWDHENKLREVGWGYVRLSDRIAGYVCPKHRQALLEMIGPQEKAS